MPTDKDCVSETTCIIDCGCGARYRRTDRKVAFLDNDAFSCRACGVVLATWNGHIIPQFFRVERASAQAG